MKWLYLVVFGILTISGQDQSSPRLQKKLLDPRFLDKQIGPPLDIRNLIIENIVPQGNNALALIAALKYARAKGIVCENVADRKIREIAPYVPDNLEQLNFEYNAIQNAFLLREQFVTSLMKQLYNYLKKSCATNIMYCYNNVFDQPFMVNAGYQQGVSWFIDEKKITIKNHWNSIDIDVKSGTPREIIGAFLVAPHDYYIIAPDFRTNDYYLIEPNQKILLSFASKPLMCNFSDESVLFLCSDNHILRYDLKSSQLKTIRCMAASAFASIPHTSRIVYVDQQDVIRLFDIKLEKELFNKKWDIQINSHAKTDIQFSPFSPQFFSMIAYPTGESIVGKLDSDINPTKFEILIMPLASGSRASIFLQEHHIAFLTSTNDIVIFDLKRNEKIKTLTTKLELTIPQAQAMLFYDHNEQKISVLHKKASHWRVTHYTKKIPRDTSVLLYFMKIFNLKSKIMYMPAWAHEVQQKEIAMLSEEYGLQCEQRKKVKQRS